MPGPTDPTYPDFLSDTSSEVYADKVAAPGVAIPAGMTEANVDRALDMNRIKGALDVARTAINTPLEARAVPFVNMVPNSQFQLMTGLGYGNKQLQDGSGDYSTVAISSYTTSSNTVTATVSAVGNTKVGDLWSISGSAHANLKICPVRIVSVPDGVTVTFGLPLGLLGVSSAACTAQPVGCGGSASVGGTVAWDGWTKDTNSTAVWREDNAVNLYPGSPYSGGIRKGSGSRENVYVELDPKDVARLAGKRVVFGAGVKQLVKGGTGTWNVYINIDGAETAVAAATSQAFTWQEISVPVPNSPTSIRVGVALNGNANDVYYLSQPMGGEGDYLGDWNYCQPKNEWMLLANKVQLTPHIARTVTWPTAPSANSDNTTVLGGGVGDDFIFRVRPFPESGGKIAGTVKALELQLNAIPSATAYGRSNALKSLLVQCVTGGARGTATFRISSDGGSTWSSTQTSVGGTATLQWDAARYNATTGSVAHDANNADVCFQILQVGNGASYTGSNQWTIGTDGTCTLSTGSGYDGISIIPAIQETSLGLRDRVGPAPAIAGGVLLTAGNSAGGAVGRASGEGLLPVDSFGDFQMFAGSMNAQWTSETIDINAVLLS